MVKKFSIRFPSEMEQSFRDANRPLLTFCVLKIGKNGFGGCVCVRGPYVKHFCSFFIIAEKLLYPFQRHR